MVFIPGKNLLDELQFSLAGIWFIEVENTIGESIVAKIPTSSLKTVYRGTPFYILLALVKTEDQVVSFTGFRIDDDSEYPLFVSQPLLNDELNQSENLENIVLVGSTRIHFFDEQNFPVVSANCIITQLDIDVSLITR